MTKKTAKTPQPRQKGIRPPLLVRLDVADYEQLDHIAAKVDGGITRPELVRRIVKEYFRRLANYEAKQQAARAA